MDALRAWTLSFCFACIVAGLMGRISSERDRFPVIKLVLALYILTAAFLPLRAAGEAELPALAFAAQAMPAPDVQVLALEAAQRELSDQIARALAAAGIECRSVDVRLARSGQEVAVERVTVGVAPGQKADGARQVVARAMGAEVPVVLQEEGS